MTSIPNIVGGLVIFLSVISTYPLGYSFGNEFDKTIDVGVYYFGGWQHLPNLRLKNDGILMDSFPKRMPLKGWFGDREDVIDYEIKKAEKYEIKYFVFLWYYPKALTPERNRLNAPLTYYLKYKLPAKRKIKFCIAYTNHNHSSGFGITSHEDWAFYTDYWLGLMKRQDYYRVSLYRPDILKPLFIIWSPKDFHEQWSSFPGGAKVILEDLRGKALKNGLPGINIAGCWDQAGSKEIFASDGYDIITGYNFHGAGDAKGGEAGHYDSLALGHKAIWDSMASLGKPVIPIITSGWDPRPWPRTLKESPYYSDRTPKKFQGFCKLTKDWMGDHDSNLVFPRTVLIYAWNELGEGGYILPTVGDGYSYLNAVKRVFGHKKQTVRRSR